MEKGAAEFKVSATNPDMRDEGCWKMRADSMDEVVRPGRSLIAAGAFLLQALNLKSVCNSAADRRVSVNAQSGARKRYPTPVCTENLNPGVVVMESA